MMSDDPNAHLGATEGDTPTVKLPYKIQIEYPDWYWDADVVEIRRLIRMATGG